ncbi:hypothetical protein DSM106972_058570 [Dulcicalothrix desertica PCC 7102]|uniref:Uncharacterized protein n=1 Tax=Dulcicalothrix desertica PCC 7102 TaxID=232991 RepID=A0A433V8N5_9CYAN|nr:hypothetical protein [Dulcicalothrix desertica]RUT02379.1 hypothetical protein DSM106972_058570 [Dulcicalothrix desertica PCC 7102]TWH55401.1 hypothetical protein CAL7102_03530 [Dulcicalothrix desertica PCC 7102]
MDSNKLQKLQNENNNPSLPQISEDVNSELCQEVEQESLKPEIKPQGCTFVRPCPTTGSPLGCVVC